MKRSRKIDEIYREKLRNVETPPPADSLNNIFARLPEEKQEKRILPIWYKFAGVAAALALLVTLYNLTYTNQTENSLTTAPIQEENKNNKIDPVSNVYREAMLRSAIILEALKTHNNAPVARNVEEDMNVDESTKYFAGLVDNAESGEGAHHQSFSPNWAVTGSSMSGTNSESRYSFLDYVDSDPELSGSATPEEAIAGNVPKEKNTAENDLIAAVENLDKDKDEDEKAAMKRRFSVTTTAGAIYFDNLGGGNVLDNQFADKGGSGEVTMAYGINLAYQVSEKVKLRTGVSKVSLSHQTQNVDFASAARSSAIESETLNLAFSRTGYLDQHLGFIEVPLEMEYAIINKKIGLSLIGGASTLFLNENEVSLKSQNSTTALGEANNLNNVSFSTNIGIGINYNLSPQFQLNLEPIFKYQLNTFNNSSGLNPYFFGIYSGLNFKF